MMCNGKASRNCSEIQNTHVFEEAPERILASRELPSTVLVSPEVFCFFG